MRNAALAALIPARKVLFRGESVTRKVLLCAAQACSEISEIIAAFKAGPPLLRFNLAMNPNANCYFPALY
jgi:hypothetical protein